MLGPARAFLFYAVAAVFVTWPLPRHVTSTVARAVRPDTWLNVWALAWTSDHLGGGRSALFDANIFYPHLRSLAYSDHFIGQALTAAPVYWLTGNGVWAYNFAWYAALVLTAWGGYLWTRAALPERPGAEPAALVAGAFCLLVPGKRTALSHLQVLSLQGVPLALYALHRLAKTLSWTHALGLAAALLYAALCSWYTAAYVALLMPPLALFALAGATGADDRARLSIRLAVAALVVVAVVAPIAEPYRELQRETEARRPIDELVETALRPVDFVASWSWLHGGLLPEGSGAGGYFPGFVAVALAILGVVTALRRAVRWPLVYAAMAACFAILSLGPRLPLPGGASLPLPYGLLYRTIPGFDALRNPYRAAFVATLLLALPVAYGAQRLFARMERRRLDTTTPRALSVPLAAALALATVHLFEAWPGPQQIEPLPVSPGGAYSWLAAEADPRPTLVWPLPTVIDENARYQLWTVGAWTPIVNGHSGLHPGPFVALSRSDADFPDPAFLGAVKESFGAERILAHYGLTDDDGERRSRAARLPGLEIVWESGNDVVYAMENGADAGWIRRRVRRADLGASLEVFTTTAARGCNVRISLDGGVVGEAPIAFSGERTLVPLQIPEDAGELVTIDMFLVRPPDERPLVRLGIEEAERSSAWVEINGWRQTTAPLVIAVLDGASGAVRTWRGLPATEPSASDALRAALRDAGAGDRVLLAAAERGDEGLIERLRLLLDGAGGRVDGIDESATFLFAGDVGALPGSALEVVAPARGIDADERAEVGVARGDCRAAAIIRFRGLPNREGRPRTDP